jgi:hypothetical protein
MILMTVRDQNRFNFPPCDRFEVRKRFLAVVFWMHSAIEHDALSANLEIIRIRADFGPSRKVNELQSWSVKPSKRGAGKTKARRYRP